MQSVPFAVPPGSLKRIIWIPKALLMDSNTLDVTLPRFKCNAFWIQMKHFRDPGGTEKDRQCKISQELLWFGKKFFLHQSYNFTTWVDADLFTYPSFLYYRHWDSLYNCEFVQTGALRLEKEFCVLRHKERLIHQQDSWDLLKDIRSLSCRPRNWPSSRWIWYGRSAEAFPGTNST